MSSLSTDNVPFFPSVEANQRQSKVIVKRTSDARGWGVFAYQNFSTGDLVMESKSLASYANPGSHTIQTGWNTHVHMDLPARFVNHGCMGTVGIRPNSNDSYDFIALTDIAKGDEVLWDYECSEWSMGFFKCQCGLPACRGDISGFKTHGQQVIEAYGKQYIAPYLFTPRPGEAKI